MTAILGISAYYHDSAAALIVDGEIVACMQEERFSRKKNDAALPRQAIFACLSQAGLSPGDLDRVVFYEDPFLKLERVLLSLLRTFPKSWKQFPRALGAQVGSKLWVLDQLAALLGIPRDRITTSTHHRSHAASAFFASPFERAAVLTVDGVGEDISTGMWLGDGTALTCLGGIEFPHSLGLLYAALTAYLGFEVNEGEYKVMGLAAFGQPKYLDEFRKLLRVGPDGSFELGMEYFAFHTDTELGFSPALEKLLGPRRLRSKPWDLEGDGEDRHYADIAASLQCATEEALVALARELKRRTGADSLCMAGGVALNCVANARILREAGFSRVFVQPAAGDAGGALGAALLGAIELNGRRPQPMHTAALGTSLDNDVTRTLADRLGIPYTLPNNVHAATAEMVAQNKVVAFARGRFEWGPRALGQRSILAAPQDAAMRERLNRAIKKREPFRPFAPAVLGDSAQQWFDEYNNDMAPYMTTISRVRPARSGELGAITHVDGTARVQTVTQRASPDLHAVLHHLEKLNGVPISLNTSLNGNGEPIIGTEADALSFFMAHSVDAMVIGDVMLQRRQAP